MTLQHAREASIEAPDYRGKFRRTLRLQGAASVGDSAPVAATIHNLSETGLLLETPAVMSEGESIDVDMGEGTIRTAQVVWISDDLIGCSFMEEVSSAGVSAAVLRAPFAIAKDLPNDLQDDGMAESENSEKLPRHMRGWIIIGAALASWAVMGAAAVAVSG